MCYEMGKYLVMLSKETTWNKVIRKTSFPGVTVVKIPPVNAGEARDESLIPGLGMLPGVTNGNPLRYSCLEHSMKRGIWQVTVHGVTESDMTEHAHVHDISFI